MRTKARILRRHLRKLKRQAALPHESLVAINTALQSGEVFDATLEAVDEQAPLVVGGFIDGLTSFLDWLIANQDGLINLIQTIISLFSKADGDDDQ